MTRLLLFVFLFLGGPAFAGDIDINAASASELDGLPGIGPAKASAIIEHREQHGPFTSVDQLDDVNGIGPATLENLRGLVTVGAAVAPARADDDDDDDDHDEVIDLGAGTTGAAPPAGNAVNINRATVDDLQELPGIGATKARAILADREANGPFASCDDLQRVTGIGPATVDSVRSACTTK